MLPRCYFSADEEPPNGMRRRPYEGEIARTLHRLHVSEFTEGREQFASKSERRQRQQHFQEHLCYENIWCLHLGVPSLNASCQTTLKCRRLDYTSGMSNDRGYVKQDLGRTGRSLDLVLLLKRSSDEGL